MTSFIVRGNVNETIGVTLKNGEFAEGTLVVADPYLNLIMKDVNMASADGEKFLEGACGVKALEGPCCLVVLLC